MLDGDGPTPLTVQCSTQSAELYAAGLPLGAGAIDLTYRYRPDDAELNIDHAMLANAAFHAGSTGLYQLDRGQMHGVQLTLDHVRFAALQRLLSQGTGFPSVTSWLARFSHALSGHGQAWFSADGSFAHPAVHMGFTLAQLALDARPLPDIRGTLSSQYTANRYRLRVDQLIAQQGDGQVQFTGNVARDGMQLRVNAHHLTLAALSPWMKQFPVSGSVDMQGTLSGPCAAPVFDADVQLAQPTIEGHSLDKLRVHLHEDAGHLQLAQGAVWLADDTPPINVQGTLPLGWDSLLQPATANARPLALFVCFPAQDISLLNTWLPALPGATGTVAGDLQFGGTLAQPQLHAGHLILLGSAAIPLSGGVLPGRLQNIELRATLSHDGQQSRVTITRVWPCWWRRMGRRKAAGRVGSSPTAPLPSRTTHSPPRCAGIGMCMRNWCICRWRRKRFKCRKPRGSSTSPSRMVRRCSPAWPCSNHAKIKQPNLPAVCLTPGCRPPAFNPRVSLVLQVGDGVKLSKGFFAIPLQKTPLPPAAVAATPPGALPAGTLPHNANGYQWDAALLHPTAVPNCPAPGARSPARCLTHTSTRASRWTNSNSPSR